MGRQKYNVSLIVVILVTILQNISIVTPSTVPSNATTITNDPNEIKSLDTGQQHSSQNHHNNNRQRYDENYSQLNPYNSLNGSHDDNIIIIKKKHNFFQNHQPSSTNNKLAALEDKTFSEMVDRVGYTENNHHDDRMPSNKWFPSSDRNIPNTDNKRYRRSLKEAGGICESEDCDCKTDNTFLIVECTYLEKKVSKIISTFFYFIVFYIREDIPYIRPNYMYEPTFPIQTLL